MQNKENNQKNKSRVVVFKLVAFLLPIIFLIIFEGLLRLFGYGDNLNLFIQNPDSGYKKYMMVNPEVGKKYFQKLEYTAPANDMFLKKKPDDAFRVFVMGSSVVYGFPYNRNLMFSRILSQQLADAYPDKKIEMVNASITAINSFTLLDYIDQILKYSPDAILIYEGHNEFYGAFGIGSNETMGRNRALARTHIALMDYRIYQMVRNIISFTTGKLFSKSGERSQGTLMKRIVADTDILYNSEAYQITMERYTQNMGDILIKAKQSGVPVFFSEVVSNINGMEPFNSIATDTLEAAIDVYRKARLAEENQDYELAHALYYRAKDLDCLRFRASEDINTIIGELSEKHNAFLVPMHFHFQDNSEHQLIGSNYMTEHVHPNVDGIFLMAEAFFNSMNSSGVLGEKSIYTQSLDYYRKNWGYTRLDTLLAYHRVKHLMSYWPFVLDESQSTNYLMTYRPRHYLDSVVISVLRNTDITMGQVRLQLAKKYESEGRHELAYREYEALIRMNPYLAVSYRDAGSSLLQLADLPRALKYYQQSLEYEESFFARFRMGEIYLIMGDYNTAIKYFDEAFQLAPNDNKTNILGKWYVALVYANRTEQAKAAAAELERVRATQFLRVPVKRYFFNDYIPFQTRDQVVKAKELMGEEKNEEALELLKSSLLTYDSHIANRLLGEIYFSMQDHENASFYWSKVYDLFRFDTKFLHNMVLLYLALDDSDNARKSLNDIKAIDPNYGPLQVLTMMIS